MRRVTSNLVVLLGAMTLLAIVIMWARSRARLDGARYAFGDAYWSVTSMRGCVSFFYRSGFDVGHGWSFQSVRGPVRFMRDGMLGLPWYEELGFSYDYAEYDRPARRGADCSVVMPYWFLALAPAAVTFVGLIRVIRATQRRRALARAGRGHCARCGYDLRATPGRCPECGRERSGDFHPPAPRVESAPQ